MHVSRTLSLVAVALAALVAGCNGGGGEVGSEFNRLPANVTNMQPVATYDGVSNDLLTAGLGKTGIGGPLRASPIR